MNIERMLVVLMAVFALGGFLIFAACQGDDAGKTANDVEVSQAESKISKNEPLPLLIDLGRGTCIPCKRMKPILEELTEEYKGKAVIKYVDLRFQPEEGRKYGIRLIPTQIFFDAEGNEVYRHEGFMDKESIIAKFREMGVR